MEKPAWVVGLRAARPLTINPVAALIVRLRDEIKFPSVDALREQIARDVRKARRYFHLMGRLPGPTSLSLT